MKKRLFAGLCIGLIVAFASGCSSQYQAERLYWQANQSAAKIIQGRELDKLTTEDYQGIISAYRRVAEKTPLQPLAAQAQFMITQLYILQGEFAQAQQELLRITRNFSSNTDIASRAQFMIGNIYERQGDWKMAVQEYEKVVDLYPLSNIGLKMPIYIAQYHRRIKQEPEANRAFAEALRNYEKILGDFDGTSVVPTIMDHIALAYLNQGKWDEALKVWERIADEHAQTPLAAKSLLASGQVYSRQIQDLKKAIQVYEDFIEQYPRSQLAKQVNFQIGRLYFLDGETDKAAEVFSQIIKDYPEEKDLLVVARTALADCYERQGKHNKAIEEYSRIIKDYPQSRQALAAPFFIARNYLIFQKDEQRAAREFAQAISTYEGIIENDSRVPAVLEAGRLLSLCYILQEQWEEASNSLQQIVDRYPDNPIAQVFLLDIAGIYQKELGRTEEAIGIYQELIDKFQANQSLANLARAQLQILQTEKSGN